MEFSLELFWNARLGKLVTPIKYWNSSNLVMEDPLKAVPIEVTIDASMSVI